MVLGQDSDTGDPSSINIRMEYLFAFGEARQKILFLFLFLCYLCFCTQGNENAGLVQPLPALFLIFQEPSTITEVMEEIFEVNSKGNIEDMDLSGFTKDTSLTPATTKN